MIKKISIEEKLGNSHIAILYPGKSIGTEDTGIGSIGRIDQANISRGTTIKMHPQVNDEILSYFRSGHVIHTDSAGTMETITRKKLMLMKSGKVFHHEEKILDKLEGLQIFIRPKYKDDAPEVLFRTLDEEDSLNTWRLFASNNKNVKLQFTSDTEVYDIQIDDSRSHEMPQTTLSQPTYILYVFQGEALIDNHFNLQKGECIVFDSEETISFQSDNVAEVVLFVTSQQQECYKGGMFSGNQV